MAGMPLPPLVGLAGLLVDRIERRHLQMLADEGFDDVRAAHNSVLASLPSEGMRLTDLARTAGISKQAMGELVDDLEAKGYVRREQDPIDGRAKLIVWADRGSEAHETTMECFRRIDTELAGVLGDSGLDELRRLLAQALTALGGN